MRYKVYASDRTRVIVLTIAGVFCLLLAILNLVIPSDDEFSTHMAYVFLVFALIFLGSVAFLLLQAWKEKKQSEQMEVMRKAMREQERMKQLIMELPSNRYLATLSSQQIENLKVQLRNKSLPPERFFRENVSKEALTLVLSAAPEYSDGYRATLLQWEVDKQDQATTSSLK